MFHNVLLITGVSGHPRRAKTSIIPRQKSEILQYPE
jgi:hypothetical protein